jgi:PTH1 family peptidyl-tRNA hydrolase
MKLICGLGNPGREYERHRHNIGFRVVDALASRARVDLSHARFEGHLGQGALAGQKVLLLKPQTFMNLSGRSLGAAARFFKVELAEILVVHDELDLPFGRLQLKSGGGSGGHNGLKSIVGTMGDGFGRLRFGVDKPQGPGARERVVGHVLANFSGEEEKALEDHLIRALEMAEAWTELGMAAAMNRFNRKGGGQAGSASP